MASGEVLIDFSLPNTPDTLKFLKLNQSDKIKASGVRVLKFLTMGQSSITKLG